MKKLESSLTNMVVVLVAVAVITGGLLAWVNNFTAEPIKVQKELVLAEGIKSVMGLQDITVAAEDTITRDVDGKEQAFVVIPLHTLFLLMILSDFFIRISHSMLFYKIFLLFFDK